MSSDQEKISRKHGEVAARAGSTTGGGRLATLDAPAPSSSGAFLLRLVKTEEQRDGRSWPYLHFQILHLDGSVVFEPGERFAAWFPVKIAWDARDRVWVHSGDSGISVWQQSDKRWVRYIWQADGPEQPTTGREIWDAESGRSVPVIGGAIPSMLEIRENKSP